MNTYIWVTFIQYKSKENSHNLIQISKQEMYYLIEKGFLKSYKGRFTDLVVLGRQKKSKNKKRLVPPSYARYLAGMQ